MKELEEHFSFTFSGSKLVVTWKSILACMLREVEEFTEGPSWATVQLMVGVFHATAVSEVVHQPFKARLEWKQKVQGNKLLQLNASGTTNTCLWNHQLKDY